MNKWVCATKELTYRNFTYGKIYEGYFYDEPCCPSVASVLGTRNDLNEFLIVPIYADIPIENYKESKRFFGIPTMKTYFFIELEEWRNQQIDKII